MKKPILIVAGFVLMLAIMIPAGVAETRGEITNVGVPEFTWNNASFPGFYYDIDNNIGAETLTFRLSSTSPTGATLSDQPDANNNRGVVYQTHAQIKTFKFKPWGQYDAIGFLADKYFAAYDPTATADVTNAGAKVAYLYDASKNRNLMTNDQISKILIDNNTEMLISPSSPLKLKEGYELAIKSISSNGTQAILELRKNGQSVDTKIIQASIPGATISDKTYYYQKDLGGTSGIVTIAVHFKNVFHGDTNGATVDGIFQISESPTHLYSSQQYGKMSIRYSNPTRYSSARILMSY